MIVNTSVMRERLTLAAVVATAAAMMRQDAIIIETMQEHEANWKAALDAANPNLSLFIATVQPMKGVQ